MSEKVYKKVEIVGCSPESVEKAVEAAVAKAAQSLHGLSWFEVKEVRGAIRDGKPCEWQVTLVAGFKLD
ncbi:MAG TPA: dodecin [Thermoanaerobaculaceae bacterium]|nr:dodecin [Thermoanaerobaculaceae bacterium]